LRPNGDGGEERKIIIGEISREWRRIGAETAGAALRALRDFPIADCAKDAFAQDQPKQRADISP
jgi:hypothetical protein